MTAWHPWLGHILLFKVKQSRHSTALFPILPWNVLETLAANSEKAGFVRFLKVECVPDDGNDDHSRAMDYLLNALVNMHSLSDFRLFNERRLWENTLNYLNKILWLVYELGIFDLLKTNSSCNTVTIIFDYKLCTAINVLTLIESSGVKPNCRFLEYTGLFMRITTLKPRTGKLSKSFRMLNYTSRWSSYWTAVTAKTFGGLQSFLYQSPS